MTITLYNRYNSYVSYNFPPKDLDKVKNFCYNKSIKYYVLSYSDKEMDEYERLFNRHYYKSVKKEESNEDI